MNCLRFSSLLSTRFHLASYACQRQSTTLYRAYTMTSKQPMQAASSSPEQFQRTSGALDPVWIHSDTYANRPKFAPLDRDIETDVCIIGSGISGIQTAYELVLRGKSVCMIEARDMLSGESSRTTGHLSNALDDGYLEIKKKHGQEGAKLAAESHGWALDRVGEIAQKHHIECEYRHLPGYMISQYLRNDASHKDDVENLKKEADYAKSLGIDAEFRDGFKIPGWDGAADQRDVAVYHKQATFHPTNYLVGLLSWLKDQSNFECYAHTRATDIKEQGIELLGMGHKNVLVETESGHKINCEHAVEATCIPLQKLSLVVEMDYDRTYVIAIRVPKGIVKDCLIYDSADPYHYVRQTACDDKHNYLVVGGCDHKVGQEHTDGRFEELEQWTRDRFTSAGTVDFKWSGQIFEPVDYMAFIGKNPGTDRIYVITGDSGNGLTHGVLAGRLIADEIDGLENAWAKVYSPKRLASIVKSAKTMITHDLQINAQYKRLLQTDINDIEDLAPGSGGVLNQATTGPIAVYKDEDGEIKKMSALCPHLKGVVCWNNVEKSWDCPVHGSRFSKDGLCITGPAKANMAEVK